MDCDELEKARARQQVLPLLRLWVGMPAQDLAKEFHVAKETVSCWEHGKQLTEKIDDVLRFLCKKSRMELGSVPCDRAARSAERDPAGQTGSDKTAGWCNENEGSTCRGAGAKDFPRRRVLNGYKASRRAMILQMEVRGLLPPSRRYVPGADS